MRIATTSLTAALAAALPLAGAATAEAKVVVDGRGWGHGIGMSQYGAYGYAQDEGRDFAWILDHFYPGTRLERAGAERVRVLLKRSSSMKLCGATRARDARGKTVRLDDDRAYRFRPRGSATLRVEDTKADRTRASLRAPVRVTGGSSVCVRGRAENGVENGRYRGAIHLLRDGGRVHAVNRVHSRHYLYGVVPAEMPTSWAIEAVKAQAVAARSYVMRSLRPGAAFDVYADVRSQMYRGIRGEDANGQRAVRETERLVLRHGDAIAHTFFHSTSGGRTSAVEDEWPGAAPAPYLRSVSDPHSRKSPVHTWTTSFSDAEAQRRLGNAVAGSLKSLRVVSRTPSGRARRVEVRGSRSTTTVSAATIRARLGLRSTWFTIR